MSEVVNVRLLDLLQFLVDHEQAVRWRAANPPKPIYSSMSEALNYTYASGLNTQIRGPFQFEQEALANSTYRNFVNLSLTRFNTPLNQQTFSLLLHEYASQLEVKFDDLLNWTTQEFESALTPQVQLAKPLASVKGIPLAEAEILVREWLLQHAKNNPAAIRRDDVAAGTGVSGGQVSKTAAWKVFRAERDAKVKPELREVPLTDTMQAVFPDDCDRPDELAALIEEQSAEMAEDERRHKRRHKPS